MKSFLGASALNPVALTWATLTPARRNLNFIKSQPKKISDDRINPTGVLKDVSYVKPYHIPLRNVALDFYDHLLSSVLHSTTWYRDILQLQRVDRPQRPAGVLRVELAEPAAVPEDGGVLSHQRRPRQMVLVVPDSHVTLKLPHKQNGTSLGKARVKAVVVALRALS